MRNIKNILVTGGAGFIGSAFIRHLFSLEEFAGNVINYDLLTYAGNLENVKSVSSNKRYFFVKGDICDEDFLSFTCEKYNVDTIVHFAAESHVDNSILGPKVFLKTNVFGTFAILETIRKRKNIHLHHISTDEVYGSLKEGFFNENSKYEPSSPYSASKAASDHFVSAYCRTYGLSITMSHCTNNYGPFQHEEKLIPLMIDRLLNSEKLPIYGKGQNIRDWLYVEDHAEAIWRILNFGKSGETYDIGGNEEKTNLEVVNTLIEVLSSIKARPLEEYLSLVSFVKDRPGHDFRYAIDCSKIKKELRWQPRHNFQEGIKKTILWYMEKFDSEEKIEELIQ